MTATQPVPVLNADQLADALGGNTRVIARQVAGLTHADSLLQPPARGNCLNWVLGHIAVHRDFMLEALGEDKVLGDAAMSRYDRGSEPILNDGPAVLPLETLLDTIAESQRKIESALERASEADLSREAPDSGSRSVAQQVCFLYWHETYHVGQTEFLRQLAGTDDQVI